jgi:hypothetical protein
MADQKNRGGQKAEKEKQEQGKKHQEVRVADQGTHADGRDMKEDARRGRQGDDKFTGGYGLSK